MTWTPKRHAAARKACEAATSGPWWHAHSGNFDDVSFCVVLQDGVDDVTHYVRSEAESDAVSENCQFIAIARTDLPAALDEIERLTGHIGEHVIKLAEEEMAHANTIDERDAFEARIDDIADALGDGTEWSSSNDRGENAVECAREVVADNARLRAMLNSIAASTADPAIKAMALRALAGAER